MSESSQTPPEDAARNRERSSTILVAPRDDAADLLRGKPERWPHFESHIDAQSVIVKLATFTPNVDSRLELVASEPQSQSSLWVCPPGLVHHLAKIDVLSTSAFLNDWNLRTGFIEFADATAAIGELIFQMKQLAALALQLEERLFIEVVSPPPEDAEDADL